MIRERCGLDGDLKYTIHLGTRTIPPQKRLLSLTKERLIERWNFKHALKSTMELMLQPINP